MTIAKITKYIFIAAIFIASAIASPANAKSIKDTPVPSDHQCNYVNFHHNEAKNAIDPGKCASDCDCDGMRSCVEGACSGVARPAKLNAETCNSKEYHYKEAWTAAGAGKCSGDCECDGLRTCSSGQCTGIAR